MIRIGVINALQPQIGMFFKNIGKSGVKLVRHLTQVNLPLEIPTFPRRKI